MRGVFFLVSLFRSRITSGCLSMQVVELSCMVSWMQVNEIPASLSRGYLHRPNGFIAFSFWLKRGLRFGLKVQS